MSSSTSTVRNRDQSEQAVRGLRAAMTPDRIGTGALAELRRLDPGKALGNPTLHKLLALYVPDALANSKTDLRVWALLVHLLAIAGAERRENDLPLGRALEQAGFSESRLSRLLDCSFTNLFTELTRVQRFLVSRGEVANPLSLYRFIRGLASQAESIDRARMGLARDYYRSQRDRSKQVENKSIPESV